MENRFLYVGSIPNLAYTQTFCGNSKFPFFIVTNTDLAVLQMGGPARPAGRSVVTILSQHALPRITANVTPRISNGQTAHKNNLRNFINVNQIGFYKGGICDT